MISFYLYSEREEAGKVPRFHVEPTTHVIRLCTGISLAWADNVSRRRAGIREHAAYFRGRGDLSELKRLRSTDGVRENA